MNRILLAAALEAIGTLPEGRIVVVREDSGLSTPPRLEPPMIESEPVYSHRWNDSTHPADVAARKRRRK